MPAHRNFQGTINYVGDRTFLNMNGQGRRLIVCDRAPFGVIDSVDMRAATNFFRDFLELQEGDPTSVQGFSSSLGPLQIIQMTRCTS